MSRSDARDSRIRAALETIGEELVVADTCRRMIALRIEQARERSGLNALLLPAIDEVDALVECLAQIEAQTQSAMRELRCAS
jgi:hypothetical protein